jgi:hypothetical protein
VTRLHRARLFLIAVVSLLPIGAFQCGDPPSSRAPSGHRVMAKAIRPFCFNAVTRLHRARQVQFVQFQKKGYTVSMR